MHYVSIVMDINRIKLAHPASFVSLPSPVGFVSSSCRAPFEVYTCGISAENKSFFVCQPSVEAYSVLPVFFFFSFIWVAVFSLLLTRNFNIVPSAQRQTGQRWQMTTKSEARKKARQILTRGYSLNSPLLICFAFACYSVSFH